MNQIFELITEKEREILKLIFQRGIITKKEIQELMNIPFTSINRFVKNLEDNHLIVQAGNANSTGGRKAIQYSVTDRDFYLIGVDISRTYVKIVISNLRLSILAQADFKMDQTFSPDKTMDQIISIIRMKLEDLQLSSEHILGIGVGTVGPVDRVHGVLRKPRNFLNQQWENVAIKSRIEEELGIPCLIDNGANAAALAEAIFGAGKHVKNLVYIHCGMGIRCASINHGQLIRAMNDTEDAFGHMIIDFRDCENDNNGTVESYASIDSIVTRYNNKIMSQSSKGENPLIVNEDYLRVIEHANQGDPAALEVLTQAGRILGLGLTNLVRLTSPQLIVLCGPLVNHCDCYFNSCISAFHHHEDLYQHVNFSKGGYFKEDAIAIGSCILVAQSYFDHVSQLI